MMPYLWQLFYGALLLTSIGQSGVAMTIFGGKLAEDGPGFGYPMGGFLVVCTKCGWHSRTGVQIVYEQIDEPIIQFYCEKCGNEAEVDAPTRVQRDNASHNGIDILPEDTEGGC